MLRCVKNVLRMRDEVAIKEFRQGRIVQPVERSLEVARVAGVGKGVEFGIYHQVARCVEPCVLGKAMIEGKVAR